MGVSEVRNIKAWAALLTAVLAASVLMSVVIAAPAWAATLTVTTAADEQNTNSQCSLREAITNANQNDQSGSAACPAGTGEDTINFNVGQSATITLASQLNVITDSAGLTIDGGSANITVSGNSAVRVFDVRSGAKLTLNNLTVADGSVNTNVGGGIYNSGALTVSNSTVSGNEAANGGGILNTASGALTVNNSTVSGNEANHGAGVYNQGTMTVSNSTVSDNRAHVGDSGIVNYGPATLENTIVANTTIADGSPSPGNCSGTSPITDGGHNLDSGTDCGFATENNSISGEDPLLGPLADNGGPTWTHALLEGSPAIDKGDSFGATTDQRGVTRPQGAASDIGAFERQAPPDTTKPRVSAATPTGPGIARGTNVAATFSEKMDTETINKTTFKLFKLTPTGTTQVTNVTVRPSSDGLKATLNPFGTSTTLLAANTRYKAVVTAGAEDLADNRLDQNPTKAGNQQKVWTFTTRG